MRSFVVLALVAALASAKPTGYTFAPGVTQSPAIGDLIGTSSGGLLYNSGLSPGFSDISGLSTGYHGLSSGYNSLPGSLDVGLSGDLSGYQSFSSSSIPPPFGGISTVSPTILGSSGISSSGALISGSRSPIHTHILDINAADTVPQTVEQTKQVYSFEAPEEPLNEGLVDRQISNVLKKNLQVVFIKAPENNAATNAALKIAKQVAEHQTVIYVLSKENDGAQLVGQVQQIQDSIPRAPEVRIIKYRTPEDAAYAREVIQSQYHHFGGPTPIIQGGVVPVINYSSGKGIETTHLGTTVSPISIGNTGFSTTFTPAFVTSNARISPVEIGQVHSTTTVSPVNLGSAVHSDLTPGLALNNILKETHVSASSNVSALTDEPESKQDESENSSHDDPSEK